MTIRHVHRLKTRFSASRLIEKNGKPPVTTVVVVYK